MTDARSTDPRFTDRALDRLRAIGDGPADALARELLRTHGADGADETVVLGRAMRAVVAGTASDDDVVLDWFAEGPGLPAWADPRLIATGQRFFRAWPMPVATALFCAALPTAYAAPHGAAVLLATSHLGERPHVARRLAETGQMLFDVMDFAGNAPGRLDPNTQGYVSARGVRLLHAVARQALLTSERRPWPARHGVPINQEDLLGTLFTFTVCVIDAVKALGVPVTDDAEAGYLHAWCAVGAVLGIDETLLPLTPGEARAVAATIRKRQLGASPAGTVLAGELLDEMRLALPPGCDGLPAALVHRLVPEVARLLEVPPARSLWPRLLDTSCRLACRWSRSPAVAELCAGPAALVGRSLLRMYVDRELAPGGPSYRLDAEVLRRATGGGDWRRVQKRTERRRRRGDVVGVGPHVGPSHRTALAALAHPVEPPVDAEDVRLIASEGYPLWEPVDVMVKRNRRITAGYADLSHRLAKAIAGPDGVLDANWCTFAAWSSKTIGTFIEDIPGADADADDNAPQPEGWPGPLPGDGGPPGREPGLVDPARLTRRIMTRSNGASFRTLAAGNRAVFLEIGLSIATFLDHFPKRAQAAGNDAEDLWTGCWRDVEAGLGEFSVLDPSWLLTPSPPPDDLRLGLRQYFEAMRTPDQELRSQHVLAGNLLLGAYEQRRVDGYVWAALALFTEPAMRRLIRDRTGAVGGVRRWPNGLFARAMTRRMTVQLPGEDVWVARPVPPPPDRRHVWQALATDAGVTLPVLQALITRYQLAVGPRPNRGARNWTSFDERMRTIGNLFRLRQRQANLFDDPLEPGA